MVSLTPTSDCDNEKSFWIHSEQTFSIYDAGIFVNSFNPDCALIQQANGSIRIHGDYPMRVVGGWQIAKPKLMTPYPPVRAAAVQYPPPFFMPDVSCSKEATVSEDLTTMTPGSWGDLFPPEGVTNLESGVYCLGGDFIMGSGSLSGNDVLFLIEGGQMHISGGVHLDLKARQSGKLAGLLVYQPITNKHPVILNAAGDSAFVGTVLAPGAQILIKGNDSPAGFHSQMVGYTIEGDGDSNVIIRYDKGENYKALYWPVVEFAK